MYSQKGGGKNLPYQYRFYKVKQTSSPNLRSAETSHLP